MARCIALWILRSVELVDEGGIGIEDGNRDDAPGLAANVEDEIGYSAAPAHAVVASGDDGALRANARVVGQVKRHATPDEPLRPALSRCGCGRCRRADERAHG